MFNIHQYEKKQKLKDDLDHVKKKFLDSQEKKKSNTKINIIIVKILFAGNEEQWEELNFEHALLKHPNPPHIPFFLTSPAII